MTPVIGAFGASASGGREASLSSSGESVVLSWDREGRAGGRGQFTHRGTRKDWIPEENAPTGRGFLAEMGWGWRLEAGGGMRWEHRQKEGSVRVCRMRGNESCHRLRAQMLRQRPMDGPVVPHLCGRRDSC